MYKILWRVMDACKIRQEGIAGHRGTFGIAVNEDEQAREWQRLERIYQKCQARQQARLDEVREEATRALWDAGLTISLNESTIGELEAWVDRLTAEVKRLRAEKDALYRRVELVEGQPVQFLAVYALRWQPEWGEPQAGFVEAK